MGCFFRWLLDKLPDFLVAAGTISAVIVALWQSGQGRRENASRVYFERAEITLRTAVQDFTSKKLPDDKPLNDRRHWLTFARGIGTAQELAKNIATPELQRVWLYTEHYWRERVWDVLNPQWDSFPGDYYGYTAAAEVNKNIAQAPGERLPLSEPSLAVVYRWIKWPEGQPDTLKRDMKFTEDEIVVMETFGPRGLARYLRVLRDLAKPKAKAEDAPE